MNTVDKKIWDNCNDNWTVERGEEVNLTDGTLEMRELIRKNGQPLEYVNSRSPEDIPGVREVGGIAQRADYHPALRYVYLPSAEATGPHRAQEAAEQFGEAALEWCNEADEARLNHLWSQYLNPNSYQRRILEWASNYAKKMERSRGAPHELTDDGYAPWYFEQKARADLKIQWAQAAFEELKEKWERNTGTKWISWIEQKRMKETAEATKDNNAGKKHEANEYFKELEKFGRRS